MKEMRVFCSHHKCATKWFLSLFKWFCNNTGGTLKQFHDVKSDNPEIREIIRNRSADILFLSNAHYSYIKDYGGKAVHLVRDPRDIVVSGYFSHRYSHETTYWPELIEHRELLNSCNQEEGLMHEIEFSGQFLRPMENWPVEDPRILTVKFEEFSINPGEVCLHIFRFLGFVHDKPRLYDPQLRQLMRFVSLLRRKGLPLLPDILHSGTIYSGYLEDYVNQNSFQRLTERKPGEEDVKSHYRKGIPGDWKQYMTSDHLEHFNKKYPGILELYSY